MKAGVEIFDSIGEVPARAWDTAVAASEALIFYSRGYLSVYEESRLHEAKSCFYVVASLDGASADYAVLPLILPAESDPLDTLSGSFPEIDLDAPCLIAPGWHCYDGLIPATSPDPRLLQAVLAGVRQIAHEQSVAWLALANVDEASRQRPALEALGLSGCPADERYALDLRPFQSFEDYVKTLSPGIRHTIRRYGRRAAEIGLESRWCNPAEADLDAVLDVVRLTAARHGSEDFYRPGPFQRFVRLLDELGLVVELRLDDRLVGAGVCMQDGRRFYQWAFGADYEAVERFSPFGILFEQTFRAALQSEAGTLESGRGNGLYKERRGLSRRRLFTYVLSFD